MKMVNKPKMKVREVRGDPVSVLPEKTVGRMFRLAARKHMQNPARAGRRRNRYNPNKPVWVHVHGFKHQIRPINLSPLAIL